MQRFVAGRLLRAVFVLWGVSSVVFVVLHLSGDPVALMVSPDTPPAAVEQLRREMGLDQPLPVQYVTFLGNILHGQFGESLRSGDPALGLVFHFLLPTVELALLSMGLALLFGVPLGALAALKRNSVFDALAMSLAVVGQSTPTFFLGIVLILVLSVQLHLLPTGGTGSPQQFLMPAVTLGAWNMAGIARLTRSAVLETIGREYIRTARAKGLSESAVVLGHVAKNAAIPVLTVLGLELGALLGGSVVVETVFSWPGVGRLVIQSIGNRDYPVVQACLFLLASGFVLINTALDVLYGVLDPRIRYA